MSDTDGGTRGEGGRLGHLALVTNSKAGALLGGEEGSGPPLDDQLRALCDRLEIVPPEVGDLPVRVARAREGDPDMLVVAGGDGTVACAAQGLAGTQGVMGLIPCGTMNVLARDLGLDPDDRAACARVLAEGAPRRIDVGELTDGEGGRHLFLCASMLGTPARLTRHREAGRARGGGVLAWAGFGLAALRALWRNRAVSLTLRWDGRMRRVRTPSLTIVVGVLDEQTGRPFGRSRLDAGVLGIYLVRRGSVLRQLVLLAGAALRGLPRAPDVETILAESIEVDGPARAMHVLADGELLLLRPPLRYRVQRGALSVMAPAP